MLLRWSLGRADAAAAIEAAVRSALDDGLRTTDLARVGAGDRDVRVLGTRAFTDEVVARLSRFAPGRAGGERPAATDRPGTAPRWSAHPDTACWRRWP